MTFAQNWDRISVEMLQKAPSDKPVMSHYPPDHGTDFERIRTYPAPRICGPAFAGSPIEGQIVRLEGGAVRICFVYTSVCLCLLVCLEWQ